MFRLILVVIFWVLLLVGFLAAGLYHFFGWKGLVAFPIVVVAFVVLGKMMLGRVVRWLLMIPFRAKASVLHKARLEIHSITPVVVLRRIEKEEIEDGEQVDEDEDEAEEEEELKHYYDVDMTITPQGSAARVWEPGEFILTTKPISRLEDMEDKEAGHAYEIRVWDGTEFGPDDPGKYPGQQRLKVTFAVKPETGRTWLQYYNEVIGPMDLPVWKV